MAEYLPVDVYGRMARMTRLKGFPQSAAYMFDLYGEIDRDRLARALGEVIRTRHPVAGCRIARYAWFFYRWKKVPYVPADYFFGPFEALRDFDPFREPPMRIHLGEGNITFELNHVAFDGVGFVRLVRSLMEQYAALPQTLPATLDEEALRREGTYWGERPRKHGRNPGRRFMDPEKRGRVLATRADFVHPTGEPGALGTLLEHVTLPLARVKERARALGCTVNDLFVAALLTQVARWNAAHGAPARYLSADIPANLRPPDRPLELAANASGSFTVNVTHLEPAPPRLGDLVPKVAAEVSLAKTEGRQWTGIRKRSTLRYPTELVVRLGTWLLRRLSGWIMRFAPTAIVSNFGLVPGIVGVDFGGVRLENMRVLGSAFAPLTLNTCSANSETCVLTFTVRRSHFTPVTIRRFASETGRLIVEGDGGPAGPAPTPEQGGEDGQIPLNPPLEKGDLTTGPP